MLTIKEILNSYKGKELFIRAFDSGIAIKANPSNFSDYQIITKIGDELFEVEEYTAGATQRGILHRQADATRVI